MSSKRLRTLTLSTFVSSALLASALPAVAQDPSIPPEDEAKAEAFVEFVENAGDWLPTVNLVDPDSLPVTFPYDDVLAHVVVDVAFGDDEPEPFMLDTGAATFVRQDIADAHGGEVLVELGNRAGGDVILWTPLQEYESLTVGDALTITQPSAITPYEPQGSLYCVADAGLLGATAMRNAVWQIDYGNEEVTVAASVDQLDHIDGAIAVPFEPSAGLSPTPHIELPVGDGTLAIVVDSGGGIPLTLNTSALAAVGLEIPEDAVTIDQLAGGAGGFFAAPAAFVDVPVTLGDRELTVQAMVADNMAAGADGNMGHVFLSNFVATFDWSTNTMYLDPLFEGDRVAGLPGLPGASTSFAGEGLLIVGGVTAGSAAAEAGLTVGELVTMVDGESVEGITLDQFCEMSKSDTKPATITTESGTYDVAVNTEIFGTDE